MKLTKKGITLLTKQYKSVLKKCFLINMGLFALGAVGAISAEIANAATTLSPTLNAYQSEAAKNVIDNAKTYFGATYELTKITDSSMDLTGKTVIVFNGERYYYTTPTTLNSVKAAMLRYLSSSTAVAMTNEDVSEMVMILSLNV